MSRGARIRQVDDRWVYRPTIRAVGGGRTTAQFSHFRYETVAWVEMATKDNRDTGASPLMRLESWLEFWLESHPGRPQTKATYRSHLWKHVIPRIGSVRLLDLDAAHIREMLNLIEAPAAQRGTYKTLASSMAKAYKLGLLQRRAMAQVPVPQAPPVERDFYQGPERAKLLRAAEESGDAETRARYLLALIGGLRQGEALGLQWKDFEDSSSGPMLHVRRNAIQVKYEHGCAQNSRCRERRAASCGSRLGGRLFGPTKSGHSRTVLLPSQVGDAVRELRSVRECTATAQAGRLRGDSLVFPSPTGGIRDKREDLSDWEDFAASAGVPALRLHDARHVAATFLAENGIALMTAKEYMGWSTSAMVNVYAHVVDESKALTASKLSEALAVILNNDGSQDATPTEGPDDDDGVKLRLVR